MDEIGWLFSHCGTEGEALSFGKLSPTFGKAKALPQLWLEREISGKQQRFLIAFTVAFVLFGRSWKTHTPFK